MNRSMKRRITALVTAVLIASMPLVGQATENGDNECQTFYNHSGNIPGSYDYAEFYEDGRGLVTTVETYGEDVYVNPGGWDAGESWDMVEKCWGTTDPIDQVVTIVGLCRVDQAGTAQAVFNAEGRPGAVFTVNGTNIGGALAGGTALFGVNTWSVVALNEGYVIVGPTEGTFTIEDCTPVTTTDPTTTTTEATTTTTVAQTTVTTEPPATTVTTAPGTLPFTGIDRGKLIALGASGLALGLLLVAGARGREEEIEEIS